MRGRPPPQTAGWLSRAVLPALPHTTHQDGALWGTSLCGTRLHAPAAGRNEGGRAGGYSHLDGTGQAWWRRCSCERGGGGQLRAGRQRAAGRDKPGSGCGVHRAGTAPPEGDHPIIGVRAESARGYLLILDTVNTRHELTSMTRTTLIVHICEVVSKIDICGFLDGLSTRNTAEGIELSPEYRSRRRRSRDPLRARATQLDQFPVPIPLLAAPPCLVFPGLNPTSLFKVLLPRSPVHPPNCPHHQPPSPLPRCRLHPLSSPGAGHHVLL